VPRTARAKTRGRRSSSATASDGWADRLRLIPGYDPFAGADGCWFDGAAAQRALDFFAEMLRHIEGGVAGEAFALEPWQQAVVANLFGWKRTDARGREVRRYRELFFYVPRKNGKTPLCAGIGLYVFFCDDEAGQQGFITAKDKEQAGLLFRQMEGMVQQNGLLRERCRVYGGNAPNGMSRSFVKPDNSFLKVISGDGGGKHGGNSHLIIIDELHEQGDADLMTALQTSMTSENRKQPLMICLTTADFDRPSVCNDKYAYAKRVQADPSYDPAFLPVVYEADPADDPYSPATWRKCNPNLGVSVSEAELARLARKAKDDPAFNVEFLRLHLDVRTQRLIENAISLTDWDAAAGAPVAADDIPAGVPCWAGLDLGWRDDFAALDLLFPDGEDGLAAVSFFWLPERTRRDLRAMPFREFVANGWVELTPGNTTDFRAIRERLDWARERFDLHTLCMDPSYARSEATELAEAGFPVEEFRQNKTTYSPPWKWLTADGIRGKKLRHGGHPVMRWMAGNTAVEVNGTDGVMPVKKKSRDKIDGITARCMALSAWLADPDKDGAGRHYSPTLVTL
jgi:phage terminase large subunit-like protein